MQAMLGRKPYQHPGRLFIAEYGIPRRVEDILSYARYLRQGKSFAPVKLRNIMWRYGIQCKTLRLPDIQGIEGFTDHESGIIFVNNSYSDERQNFTVAHEFIEMLYSACKESPEWECSVFATMPDQKERLCNKGAAALLIPAQSLQTFLNEMQPSLQLASNLSNQVYKTSWTACVHRMVELSHEPCAMIVWRQSQFNEQESLPDKESDSLHVWWAEVPKQINWQIPRQQSAPTLVHQAYKENQLCKGKETLTIGNLSGSFTVEAKKVAFGDQECVLSLVSPLAITR